MTETQASPADVTADVSTQEMNDYFESGGEKLPGEVVETQEESPSNDETESLPQAASADIEAEISEDESADVDGQKHTQNYKAAMHEERERRKEIQRQVEQMKAENEQLKTTFQKILAKAQEQQELDQQAREPTFDEDPLAALKNENQKIKNTLTDLQKFKDDQAQNYELQAKQAQFMNAYRAKVNEFTQTTPDFSDAYKHLMESRLAEFEAAGYSKEQANQLIHEDEAAIVATALSQNANPGERLYRLAKLRGYQGKTTTTTTQQTARTNEQKIASLEKGLRASKSINNTGSQSDERLTLEAVADMDDAEFAKFDWNKLLKLG